jgi:hypothetical protein
MHTIKDEFTVNFPIDIFTEWVKQRAVNADIISDHVEVKISDVSFDTREGAVIVIGDFTRRMDS